MNTVKYLILSLLCSVSLACVAGDFASGGYVYDFGYRSGEVMLTKNIVDGVNAYEGVCIIPSQVTCDGEVYAVTAIDDEAFAGSKVTDVVIPNSVTSLGYRAFAGSDELASVTLPLYIDRIPDECFAGTALENVAVPEGVKSLGEGSFHDCYKLHTVMLPSSLKVIEDKAFSFSHNLYEIYCAAPLPPTCLGEDVFYGLSGVDVVVTDYEAIDAYASNKAWGNEDTFTLFPNEDVYPSLDLAAQVFDQDWQRVPLGYNLAYKVFDKSGELMALTAASNLYLQALDHDVTYTIVPTTMMSDSDPAYFTVDKATGLKEFIDDAFPAEPEPIIVAHWGTLYVYGDNYNKMVSVWDMNGHLYYERMSSDAQVIDLPRNRVYVVKVGKYVKKIFV